MEPGLWHWLRPNCVASQSQGFQWWGPRTWKSVLYLIGTSKDKWSLCGLVVFTWLSFRGIFLLTPLNTAVREAVSQAYQFAPKQVRNWFWNQYIIVNIPTLFFACSINILPFFSLASDSLNKHELKVMFSPPCR